jgi:hypothetical protein
MVQRLLSKYKTLSSNSGTDKGKKNISNGGGRERSCGNKLTTDKSEIELFLLETIRASRSGTLFGEV